MVFSSLLFLFVYLPVVLLIYYAAPLKLRNLILLVFSLVFYGWGEPVYIVLMLFSTVLDYTCGRMIDKYRDVPKLKKLFLLVSVIGNLGLLGVFKYLDFIILNLRHIPALSSLQPLGIPLPIGISFYTFQTMSYTIDVYRGINKTQKNIITMGTYVTLFPQLIAGPIVKYKDVSAALECRRHSFEKFADGVCVFTIGLCKKVLIANSVGELFQTYQAIDGASVTVMGAWLAALAYTFQIYFDFSGYSDMAIGLGKMFAFDFLPNFNYPYTSNSITDFWRRWHISLSSWFREYLYIPLGGSRKGFSRTIANLFIVWMATGIWHGASWNYVLWGLYYFILLAIEKIWLLKILNKTPPFLRYLYTMLLVILGWVLFSNEDLTRCLTMLRTMFGAGGMWSAVSDIFYLANYAVIFLIACLASVSLWKRVFLRMLPKTQAVLKIVLVLAGLLLCTASLVDSTYNPFLYFRF